MRLNQLKKLVTETVRAEQRKGSSKTRRPTRVSRNFNTIVESAVSRVLFEAEGDETEDDAAAAEESGAGMSNIVKDGMKGLSSIGKTMSPEDANQMDSPNPKDAVDVSTGQVGFAAKALMPSQSSMDLRKAVHFALGMLNSTMYNDSGNGIPGGDTGAFICNKYLLDGHHRWVATCLVAPGAQVNGYEMKGISAEQAVGVLNAATGVLMGHNKGKSGEGSFGDFHKPEAIETELRAHNKKGKKTGVPNESGDDKATEICEKWAAGEYSHGGMAIQKFDGEGEPPKGEEALKWASQAMAKNAKSCGGVDDGKVLTQLPRVEMPVADDLEHASKSSGNPIVKDTDGVIDALTKGKIDLTTESVDIRRWNKLAGLLKD